MSDPLIPYLSLMIIGELENCVKEGSTEPDIPAVPFANSEPNTNTLSVAATVVASQAVAPKGCACTVVAVGVPFTIALYSVPVAGSKITINAFSRIACGFPVATVPSLSWIVSSALPVAVSVHASYEMCKRFCSLHTTWSEVIGISAPTIFKKPESVRFP